MTTRTLDANTNTKSPGCHRPDWVGPVNIVARGSIQGPRLTAYTVWNDLLGLSSFFDGRLGRPDVV